MNFQDLVNELRAEGMPLYFRLSPKRVNIFIDKRGEEYDLALISMNDETEEVAMNLPHDITLAQTKIIKKFMLQENYDDMLTNNEYEYFLTLGNPDDIGNICYIKRDGDKYAFTIRSSDTNSNELSSEYVFTDMREIKKIINVVNANLVLKGDE